MKRMVLSFMALVSVLTLSAQSEYDFENNPVLSNIMARRSIRKYLDKPVEHAKLEVVVRAGINAPSAVNRQPWIVRVVEDQKLIADVTEVYKEANAEMVSSFLSRTKDFFISLSSSTSFVAANLSGIFEADAWSSIS